MAKRKIPVSNNQVNETKLINSLNSNLLKKEDENTNSIKEESPAEEKTLYTIMKEEREEALAKTEPATDTPQDELPGPYAANACNCGPEIVKTMLQILIRLNLTGSANLNITLTPIK